MATKIPKIKFYNSVVKNKMPEAEGASIGEIFINANEAFKNSRLCG